MEELIRSLRFGKLSGCMINEEKSTLMGSHVENNMRDGVGQITNAQWKSRRVQYLGVLLSKDIKDLVEDNVIPLLKNIEAQLKRWARLKIS